VIIEEELGKKFEARQMVLSMDMRSARVTLTMKETKEE
jgi:hypothetical protein